MPNFPDQIRAEQAEFAARLRASDTAAVIRQYVIVDCAQNEMLGAELDGRSRKVRFLARSGRNGAALVAIGPGESTLDWLFANGEGNRWFITILSRYDFEDVWSHARRFTQLRLYDERLVSFRFFDPLILANQTRAFSPEQRKVFFDRFNVIYADVNSHLLRLFVQPDCNISWKILSDAVPLEGSSAGVWSMPQIDLAGSVARTPFRITKEQYERPILLNPQMLMNDLYQCLLPDFETRMRRHIPGLVRAMIEIGANLAIQEYLLDDLECVRQFVDLQWRVAPGFDQEPQINALLRDLSLSPAQRFERLASPAYTDAMADAFGYDSIDYWRLPFRPQA